MYECVYVWVCVSVSCVGVGVSDSSFFPYFASLFFLDCQSDLDELPKLLRL